MSTIQEFINDMASIENDWNCAVDEIESALNTLNEIKRKISGFVDVDIEDLRMALDMAETIDGMDVPDMLYIDQV